MDDKGRSRRELLRDGLRGLALAAIAAIVVKVSGKTVPHRDDHRCDGLSPCRDCRKLDVCILPQAQSVRQVLRK